MSVANEKPCGANSANRAVLKVSVLTQPVTAGNKVIN
jgi:hypothetical protein